MKQFLVALMLLLAVLLAGIFYELHGLNRRLDDAALATRGVLAGITDAMTPAGGPETELERRERKVREIQAQSEELAYVLNRLSGVTPAPKTSPK